MSQEPYADIKMEPYCKRIHAGEYIAHLEIEVGISSTTLRKYYRKWCVKNNLVERKSVFNFRENVSAPPKEVEAKPINDTGSKILIYDIETLPNLGYFFDTFSERAIPLDFIVKPKSICTIAWKWYGSDKTDVAVMDEPYEDKTPLQVFLPEWKQATHVVAHYSRFDKPFIAARLMANNMESLPPVNDICTYKLAKAHFGRSLNGNKLDHLGTILGVGRKNKTNANLWVGCANGDKDALAEMAAYNAQDVDLLADVFKAMLPHVKSKLNFNLTSDAPTQLCKQCGSDDLKQQGFEYTVSSMRHRFICNACGSWNTFNPRKL